MSLNTSHLSVVLVKSKNPLRLKYKSGKMLKKSEQNIYSSEMPVHHKKHRASKGTAFRTAFIKKIIKEKNMSLLQTSHYIKANNLY